MKVREKVLFFGLIYLFPHIILFPVRSAFYEGMVESFLLPLFNSPFPPTFPLSRVSLGAMIYALLYIYVCLLNLGGLKLWEGSLDLVKALRSEVQNGHLSFAGKRVLEVST